MEAKAAATGGAVRDWRDLPRPDPHLASELCRWWSKHGRSFLWRHTSDPFRILCTEIMLQRTRAAQVEDVYRDEVRGWTGPSSVLKLGRKGVDQLFARLGLQWRARYFWDLQRTLQEKFADRVPRDWKKLRSLPGVGEYVATAVLVFAFGERRTVVDSNVLRILGRYYGIEFPDHARRSKRVLEWATLHAPDGSDECRTFNWALIDLGATVCTPSNPMHSACPIRQECWLSGTPGKREQES